MFRSDYNADKNLKGKTNACQSEGNVLFCEKMTTLLGTNMSLFQSTFESMIFWTSRERWDMWSLPRGKSCKNWVPPLIFTNSRENLPCLAAKTADFGRWTNTCSSWKDSSRSWWCNFICAFFSITYGWSCDQNMVFFYWWYKKNNVDIAEMYIYQGIFGTLFVQETRWHFFFKKNTTFWIAKKNIRFFLIRTTLWKLKLWIMKVWS